MIKNCGPVKSINCLQPVVPQNVDPVARALNPSFDFNRAFNGQWISLVVSDVKLAP
jgi:hypothetical protein